MASKDDESRRPSSQLAETRSSSSLSSSFSVIKDYEKKHDGQADTSNAHPPPPPPPSSTSLPPLAKLHTLELDPVDAVNLPYRTVTVEAQDRLREYTEETATGLQPVVSMKRTRTGELQSEKYELVTFVENDAENPKNWSKAYKWWCTMVVAITCFAVAFNSAVITADPAGPAETFGVSEEVSLLATTLFVLGFGLGPMVFAPLSEILGRRIMYASTLLVAVVFIIPCAVADNIATLLVCRLIDGIAFSARK